MCRFRGNGWLQSATTAVLTVIVGAVAIAQPPGRITNRDTSFSDMERMLRDGTRQDLDYQPANSQRQMSAADLARVDRTALTNLIAEAVRESDRLYRALESDYRRNAQLRPQMTDLLKLRANASRLKEDLDRNVSLDRILPQFQQLDSDWRLLSHQMAQIRSLSQATRESVDRIDRIARQMEQLFQLEPQLDRRQLLLSLSRLDVSLRNLIEEVEVLETTDNRTYQLTLDCRKLRQQAYRVQMLVLDQAPYEYIVTEYSSFHTAWESVWPRLQIIQNDYIYRSVRQVVTADREVNDLLWLDRTSNREVLRQIADGLRRDVDEFYSRTPLKLLLNFQNISEVMATAHDFYGTVQHLQDCLTQRVSDQELMDCYTYVEEYGQEFVRTFAPMRSQTGLVVLRKIEDGIAALRTELNLSGNVGSVDTRELLITAAALENLADHLDLDVQKWLREDPQNFRSEALRASQNFKARTQRLHRMLTGRPALQDLRRETADLYEEWRVLYNYLGRCRTADRQHMSYIARDISQSIYEIRAPLQI